MTYTNIGARKSSNISRTMVLELVRATEAAARAAVRYMGQKDKEAVDGAAVEAMRRALDGADIHGTVVIGEGEKDEAPMLYIGEKVGSEAGRAGGPQLDIAVDPVDGTTLASLGLEGAIAVLAAAERGCFLNIPDVHYMDKLVVGPSMDITRFSLDMPAEEMVIEAAQQKGVKPSDIVVCMLDRPRNEPLMQGVKKAGGRMKLIPHGDIAGAIDAALPETSVDMLIGRGGAPEGIVAASALKCLGGNIIARPYFSTDTDGQAMREKTIARGIQNPSQTFTMEELVQGETLFAATGVTDGSMLKGVHRRGHQEMTYSVVMRSSSGTVRYIKALHRI